MAIPERPRILFVENEHSISEPFSKALAREGFEPHVAGTAARALELAEQLDPDLILLDLHLPDGDGRDVCRTIRARSGVPIIILTARGTGPTASSGSSSAPTTTSSSRSRAPR